MIYKYCQVKYAFPNASNILRCVLHARNIAPPQVLRIIPDGMSTFYSEVNSGVNLIQTHIIHGI